MGLVEHLLTTERAAFDYFKRHQDQTYSAVDCLSFVIMEKLGIREALAVDSDFTHRFIARPPGRYARDGFQRDTISP